MSFLELPSAAPRVISIRRFASNLAVACLGASVVLAALRLLGPVPTQITLDAARVLRERERCEVLFAGPSYVVSQIYPSVFDSAAARLGEPLRSCIFGGTGLRGVELRVHLEDLLDQGFPRLQLVVVDITLGHEPRFDEENWYHPRTIQWHTWASMQWIFDYYRKRDWDITPRQLAGHLAHLAANYSNLGVGLEHAPRLALTRRALALALTDAAYVPPMSAVELDYESDLRGLESQKKKQSHKYVKTTSAQEHAQRVKSLDARKRRLRRRGASIDGAWPADFRSVIRARGYEAFFLGAPVWKAIPPVLATPAGEPALVFFDFNSPKAYPELYLPKNRGRTHHVSWYGGVAYSELLAREVLAVWKPRR